MKHSRRLLPLLLLVLLLAARIPLRGQTLLDDYRRDVLRYSRALKMAASASRAAGERLAVARTGYLPRLSLDGSFSVAMRRSEGAKPWSFGVTPQLVQTLYGGGAVRAAVDEASLGSDIALCDEEFTRFEVCYSAEYTYWNLSAMEEFAASMRRYVGLIRSLKEVVDYRFSEGYVARSDVLMIDARLSEAAYELLTTERNLAVARHNSRPDWRRASAIRCRCRRGWRPTRCWSAVRTSGPHVWPASGPRPVCGRCARNTTPG